MKAQNERPDLSEMPPYRLGRHWNTIQAYLIPGIEDDIGELSEEMKNHLRAQIYTIYTFYTAIKEGFATTSKT